MNNTKSTQEVIDIFYNNIAKGKSNENIKLFSDNIEWRIPGNDSIALWIKDRNTKEEVADFYKDLYQYTEPLTFDITGKFISNNKAVVTGNLTSRIKKTGKIFASPFSVQFIVRDGLITHYLMLEDSFGLTEAMK